MEALTWSLKKIKNVIQEAPWVSMTLMRYGIPRRVVSYGGGIGDDLMLTTVLHELNRRGGKQLWVLTKYPELFCHNKEVNGIVPPTRKACWLLKRLGVQIEYLFYSSHELLDSEGRDIPPPSGRHIISCLCQTAGISGKIALKPYIFLTDREHRYGQLVPRQVAIQNASLGAAVPMTTKQWFSERFQTVVNALKGKVNFVQLGLPCDPLLKGVTDLRGKTSLRETASILSQSMVFIGLVGFLMHLARAVNRRSVIIYGGREGPEQSGYSCNENLFTEIACSRCWIYHNCPHSMECMRRIDTEMVIAAVERQMDCRDMPMLVDYDYVPNEALVINPTLCSS